MGACNCAEKNNQNQELEIDPNDSYKQENFQNLSPQSVQVDVVPYSGARLEQTPEYASQSDHSKANMLSPEEASIFGDLENLNEVPENLLSEKVKQLMDSKGSSEPPTNEKGPVKLNDGRIYIGQWNQRGVPHGKGRMIFPDGCVYEGEWEEGRQTGNGHKYWPDGNFYEGAFVNGLMEGNGKLEFEDGNLYEGEFSKDMLNGFGKFLWADKGMVYEGNWFENQKHGRGTCKWSDGRTYEGEYAFDKKEGYGVFSWPNGKKYEGEWKAGKQHGEGTLIKGGRSKRATWENGKVKKKK